MNHLCVALIGGGSERNPSGWKKRNLENTLLYRTERFNTGYFALVMATGIVSIAALSLNMKGIAWSLFRLNKLSYAILIILWIACLLRCFTLFVRDISSLEGGPALFTIVAGTCILGSEFVLFSRNFTAGLFLWLTGTVLWFVFFYAFFTKVIMGETDLSFVEKFDEGWLIYAVGTQSVSLLSTLIAPGYPAKQETFLLFALLMYLLGGALYLLLIVLILYRLLFFSLPAQKLTPLYWISMGVGAITTLSGTTLLLNNARWIVLRDMVPFLSGLTLSSWAVTTWWIPLLTALYVWRYAHMRFPVVYDIQYWCMVFPFGMYACCTLQLGTAMGLKAFAHISFIFFLCGSYGMGRHFLRVVTRNCENSFQKGMRLAQRGTRIRLLLLKGIADNIFGLCPIEQSIAEG